MRWCDVSGIFAMSVIDLSLELLACWSKSNQAILRRKASTPTTADARKLRRSNLKDHLPSAAFGNGIVSVRDIVWSKLFFSQQRLQLTLLREFSCLLKNVPVIGTPNSRQQGQQ